MISNRILATGGNVDGYIPNRLVPPGGKVGTYSFNQKKSKNSSENIIIAKYECLYPYNNYFLYKKLMYSKQDRKLAIIIPAYKISFLDAALRSIDNQTCKNFTLYIGDDYSPYNLYDIISKYLNTTDIVYHRFENNMGKHNLVGQWERCIDMTKNEKWIWLFSDDDVMEPQCVEYFYKSITKNEYSKNKIFHFGVKQINEKGEIISKLPPYPQKISAKVFLDMRLKAKIFNFVTEFIFDRELFIKSGRFENFDLAWGTDFITFIKMSEMGGEIITIDKANIMWRSSNENISPNTTKPILLRKLKARIDNAVWIKQYIKRNQYSYYPRYYKFIFGDIMRKKEYLDNNDITNLAKHIKEKLGIKKLTNIFIIYWYIKNIKILL